MAKSELTKLQADEETQGRRKVRRTNSEKSKAQGETPEGSGTRRVSSLDHASLLSDRRPSHGVSAEQKAIVLGGLQQSYGNTYVQGLLGSQSLQAKLTVNPPDDQYEREADRVAEMVARLPESEIQRQEDEGDEDEIRAKTIVSRVPEVSEDLEGRINVARGTGQPLPDSVRGSLEPHFGRDLSDVRIHTGTEANSLSQELGAKAFTTGHNVFFKEGAYQPESESGRRLLGHELAHVAQQEGTAARQVEKKNMSRVRAAQMKDAEKNPEDRALEKKPSKGAKADLMELLPRHFTELNGEGKITEWQPLPMGEMSSPPAKAAAKKPGKVEIPHFATEFDLKLPAPVAEREKRLLNAFKAMSGKKQSGPDYGKMGEGLVQWLFTYGPGKPLAEDVKARLAQLQGEEKPSTGGEAGGVVDFLKPDDWKFVLKPSLEPSKKDLQIGVILEWKF